MNGTKTFVDLLQFIANDFPDKSLRDVAKMIGMSEASYYQIKKGRVPKEKLLRVLKSYLIKNYNLTFELTEGSKVKVKSLDTHRLEEDNKPQPNIVSEKRTKYLLDRVIELEEENERLKAKLNEKGINLNDPSNSPYINKK